MNEPIPPALIPLLSGSGPPEGSQEEGASYGRIPVGFTIPHYSGLPLLFGETLILGQS